ncbi:MAG: HEAT repeat domain-containing protein [Polyangiales bacterium]
MASPTIGHFERVLALACDGRLLAVGGARPTPATQITLFDVRAQKPAGAFDVPAHVRGLAFAGERLLAACADGRLRAWHLATDNTPTAALDLALHAGACNAVATAPDGDRVATAGDDGHARLASLAAGAAVKDYALSAAPLRAVAVDPTGEYLAAAGDDGVVRVVTLATGAVREMAGHEGAVHALAFTPRDGRLASAGDDGVIRVWYLVGAVEFEARGAGDDGHKGPVYALAFLPPVKDDANGVSDRFVSAGAEGKLKAWRLDDRRKPRTLDGKSGPLRAVVWTPPPSNAGQAVSGSVLAAGEQRRVARFSVAPDGAVAESPHALGSGFDGLADDLRGQKPAREAAVKRLASLDEPEAVEVLAGVMKRDPDVAVRALAIAEAASHGRAGARATLRELLADAGSPEPVYTAAFGALRALDGASSLGPLRAALASPHPGLRATALAALVPLRASSPLVPAMVAERLTDAAANVQVAALDALTALHPADSVEPLRLAYERGGAGLKVEVLVRATQRGLLAHPDLAPVVSRALDDADANVRRHAFTGLVLSRAKLLAALERHDDGLKRTVTEVVRHLANLGRAQPAPKGPTDAELQAARASIATVTSPGDALTEDDLAPLHAAMACRTPDTALRGARALALLGDTRALGALLQLSREADATLRAGAAAALRSLEDPRARKRLVWMLDDADADVRAAALDAYARFRGTKPLEVAEASLRASHEDIRARGLDQLVKLGPAEATDALLADAIEDESAKVRAEAFRALWAWHDKDPAPALDRALAARFPDLRLRAVHELTVLGAQPWALERLRATVADRDAAVALAAHAAVEKLAGESDAAAHVAAMASALPEVRAAGAKAAVHAPAEAVRSALVKLLDDAQPGPRTAAAESLDKLLPDDAGPLRAALQSSHLDLRVRAAELLTVRHDEHLADPMRALLADKDLARTLGAPLAASLRQRAAAALATLGAPRLVRYFATELLKDDDALVREHAARGLATAARRGDEGHLLDALGHADAWVRSWAADGLSRLGDARALPVLTGNLRHDHLPIRVGAILSFAALGPEGYGGMLLGLEDATRDVQEMVFAILLARDLRAFRRGEAPELLTSALSSQRPDVRFAAARALELRVDPEAYLACVVEALSPAKPEKAAAKDWPPEERRVRALVGLAEALAGDRPEQRYAAAQVLHLKKKPGEFFREAERAAKLRSVSAPWVPDTAPRAPSEGDAKPPAGWLRRLFAEGASEHEGAAKRAEVPAAEQRQLRRLAFGAYVGLLRQSTTGDEEGHRTRRDAIERIVELGLTADVGVTSAVPALARALDDANHLVRKAAFAGLQRLHPAHADEPVTLALASRSSDVGRAALDELFARGADAWPRLVRALGADVPDVRRYAFELLERLAPKGSLDAPLAALASEHADLRVGVIERLATSNDPRVTDALDKALASEHDDLRLRAAELLAARKSDRPADVLAAFLRGDDVAAAGRATTALVTLATPAAARALSARADELTGAARAALVGSIGTTDLREAIDLLVPRFADDDEAVRAAALSACRFIAMRDPKKRDAATEVRFLAAAARARAPMLRRQAAALLVDVDDPRADELLTGLFADRETPVRVEAATSYAARVQKRNAPVEPLDALLRLGQRELVLPAAEGVASKGLASALRPLLLVVRAGEPGERERALLALGTLGDGRALEEVEAVANGGTPEAPVEPSMVHAAIEALGRMAPKLADPETRARLIERVELLATDAPDVLARAAALRGVRYVGGERARAKLESVLADGNAPELARQVAAVQLGELNDTAAEPCLARALHDVALPVRASARAALEALFPKDQTRVELLALESPHADVAGPAATFLATEGDPAGLAPRLGTLDNAALRARLRYGLLRRAAAPADALCELLESDRAYAREEAAWLIGARTGAGDALDDATRAAFGRSLVSAARRAASSWPSLAAKDRYVEASAWAKVLWAAARVGASGLEPLAQAALAATTDVHPTVRAAAARALDGRSDEASRATLTAALTDPDASVRAAAARALADTFPTQAPALAAAAQPFDPVSLAVTTTGGGRDAATLANEAARKLALPSLLARRETAALAALAASTAADATARLDAIGALGLTGGDDAREVLEAIAFDKKNSDAALRKAAYRALRRARRADERRAAEEGRVG